MTAVPSPTAQTESKLRRKLAYVVLRLAFLGTYVLAWVYSVVHRRSRSSATSPRSLAAVWYYPPELHGSNLRLGHWKHLFEAEGFQYDNFHVGSLHSFVHEFERGSWHQRYVFYRRLLLARFRQFLQLRHYDVVWVDRGFVPYYPLRKAFFERCLRRMVPRLVVDSSDGSDYQSNAQLVLDTIAQADTLTVACKVLYDFYKPRHPDVRWFNWTLPMERYQVRQHYRIEGRPVVGWMGSPQLLEYVKQLENDLAAAAAVVPFTLRIICRTPLPFAIRGVHVEFHSFDEGNYFDLLVGFDVGLCPFPEDDFASRGKVAMKHQEFMICGVPQVCSPVAICEETIDGENAMIAWTAQDWAPKLLRLLQDEPLREHMGRASRRLFERLYTYEGEYPKARDALLVPRAADPGPGR